MLMLEQWGLSVLRHEALRSLLSSQCRVNDLVSLSVAVKLEALRMLVNGSGCDPLI